MLRISRLADYGVVLGTRLGALTQGDVRSVRGLAEDTGIPQPTVSKILKALSRAGLTHAERGAQGGYRLARDPGEVTVAEVIVALEGPIGVTECGLSHEHNDGDADCQLVDRCDVRGNWQRINSAIASALEGITLAEMARPAPDVLVTLRRRAQPRPTRAHHPAGAPAAPAPPFPAQAYPSETYPAEADPSLVEP